MPKPKHLSTRVDLTPMVDLGFLLLTFFVLTTSLSSPKMLRLIMPADGPPIEVGKSTALTLIPLSGDRVFYYHGELNEALQKHLFGITDYSMQEGVGHIIRQKQAALDRKGSRRSDLMLIIKPSSLVQYRHIVDLLDEVLINDVSHYSFTDLAVDDKNRLNQIVGNW